MGNFREALKQYEAGKKPDNLNEAVEGINDWGIGYIITYTLFMTSQVHVWHLLCPSGQKHMALGELYNELQDEVDELAEKFIAQGGTLTDCSVAIMAEYDEYKIVGMLDTYRQMVTSAISTVPSMASIVDGLTDLQEVIDAKLYKFKLQ